MPERVLEYLSESRAEYTPEWIPEIMSEFLSERMSRINVRKDARTNVSLATRPKLKCHGGIIRCMWRNNPQPADWLSAGTTCHQFLCRGSGLPLQAIGLQMWRTQSHQLPHFCKCKLRSKWAGWYGPHVLNLCHARRSIRWNSNECDACRLFTQGPAGLGKSESGFRGLLCAAAWMLITWFFCLLTCWSNPRCAEGHIAVEPRYVTIIVFAIIRVAWLFAVGSSECFLCLPVSLTRNTRVEQKNDAVSKESDF